MIPTVLPGVHAVHAVDAAGVHPLLLAIGSERYVPYAATRRPQELLTQRQRDPRPGAAVAGQVPADRRRSEDDPELDIHDIAAFFRHLLERVDWRTRPALPDAHDDRHARLLRHRAERGLEAGDRRRRPAAARRCRRDAAARACAARRLPRPARRACPASWPSQAPPFAGDARTTRRDVARFCAAFRPADAINAFPLIVLVDDSEFAAAHARTTSCG